MPFIDEYSLYKWTKTGVDMKTAQENVLLQVPTGKTLVVVAVAIRGNSASLAGGTSYSFGVAIGATGWRQTVDLSGLTVTDGYRILLSADNTTYTPQTATQQFVIKVITGATAAGTATIDVIGYLV